MLPFLHELKERLSARNARKEQAETKLSAVSRLKAFTTSNEPIWTSADYQSLAENGYGRNVIVYRAVNLIARSAGSVPWQLFDHEERVDTHPLLNLLNNPNPLQGGNAFREAIISYLLLSGNAYIEACKDADGNVVELYVLRPDRMRVVPSEEGIPSAYEYTVGSSSKRIEVDARTGNSSILHLKLFNPLNDWYGMSPLEAGAQAIAYHKTLDNHNLALLQNGGRPSGALLVNHKNHKGDTPPLTETQLQELRDSVKEACQGTQNAGQVMVLEGDFDWKEMGFSPKDMDFTEGNNITSRKIAQLFGVPPMLVGVPGDATFSNYREARLHLWEDTVLPLLDRLLNQLNTWLAPHFGDNLRLSYDPEAIQPIAEKRAAKWQQLSACNFLTNNEKRHALGYPALDGGDVVAPPLKKQKVAVAA
jgi:HK97 family phage portal protein